MTLRSRPLALILAALLAVALLVWWRHAHHASGTSAPPPSTGSSASAGPTAAVVDAGVAATGGGKRVTRLTPERRAQLASQIQAAKAARARPSLPPAPSTPASATSPGEGMTTPQEVLDQFLKLADEIRGYVKDCASTAPDLHEAKTSIVLVGDPDIGTLIDAPDPATGSDGRPVPAAFDECIRGALQTLELPPMQTGDAFKVSFQLTM